MRPGGSPHQVHDGEPLGALLLALSALLAVAGPSLLGDRRVVGSFDLVPGAGVVLVEDLEDVGVTNYLKV